ncbi:MAG: 50S ribosomal protein L11 methyltransferase [Acidimicrobiales bacterium]
MVDDDGHNGWRAWAEVERAGPFSLVPTWVEAPVVPDAQFVIRLDPGRAFGSGSHPTTRATLAALAPLVRPHTSVLDVGCGSGVLAIAAAMLGGGPVVAVDVDPDAVDATAANASVNGVDRGIHVSDRALPDLVADGHCFDVVVANLLAPVFEEHGRNLVRVLAPGGRLVASGLLADNWRRTADALAPLAVVDLRGEQGWVALTLT